MRRRKVVHVCGACKAEFDKKRECWWHMDNACPARNKANDGDDKVVIPVDRLSAYQHQIDVAAK